MDVKKSKHIITLFFLLVLFCLKSESQQNYLDRKITLTIEKETIENALIKIGKKGNFEFSYNADIINTDSIISINVQNQKVHKILDDIFTSGVQYKITGRHIVILNRKKSPSPKAENNNSYIISGTITDSRTGKTIKNATVLNMNDMRVVLTDSAGFYSLEIPSGKEVGMGFSKDNYLDTVIIIRPATDHTFNMYLKPVPKKIDKINPKKIELPETALDEISIVKFVVKDELIVNASNLQIYERRPVQISFLPYAGSNSKISGSIKNYFSLNVFSGYSGGTNGIEIGGFLNIDRLDVSGCQLGGFGNIVGGNTTGLQIGGFFNNNMGRVSGVQISGFSNTVFDTLVGVQISGFSNVLKGKMHGLQISGFNNFTTKNVDAVQLSGFSNIALQDVKFSQISGFFNYGKNVTGLQLAGFANIANGNSSGMQLSGFANITKGELSGVQVAGFLNYAKKIKGFQLAFINVSDTVSGIAFGVFNIIKKGYRSLDIHFDDMTFLNTAFKMGTHKLYNIYGLAAGMYENKFLWGPTLGMGTLLNRNKKLSYAIDLTCTGLYKNKIFNSDMNLKNSLAVQVNYKLGNWFRVFAGPAVNLFITNATDSDAISYINNTALYTPSAYTVGKTSWFLWVGFQAGIRFGK